VTAASNAFPLAEFMLARKITLNPGRNSTTAEMQHVLPDISNDAASTDMFTEPFLSVQLGALNAVSNTTVVGNALTDAFAMKNTQQPYQGELFWNAVNNFKELADKPKPDVGGLSTLACDSLPCTPSTQRCHRTRLSRRT